MMPASTTVRSLTPDGVEISCAVAGDGPVVILLHGVTEDGAVWERIENDLAQDHRVVRIDFRGHGTSMPVAKASLDDFVMDVQAVTRALGVEKPILVGHSLGGAVATAYAGRHPTAGVVNIDQPMRFGPIGTLLKSLESRLRGAEFPMAMSDIVHVLGVGSVPEPMRRELFAYRERVNQSLVLSIWHPFFAASAESLDDLSVSIVRAVHAPYLSIHGSDPGTDYTEWLTGLMPSAKLEVWHDLGHWVQLVAPSRCGERVRQFVRQVG